MVVVDREHIEEILRRSEQRVRRSADLCAFSQKRSAATRDAIQSSLEALKKCDQFMKYNSLLIPPGLDRDDRRGERIAFWADLVHDQVSLVNDGQNMRAQGGSK